MGDYLVTHRFDDVADTATAAILIMVDADKELVLGIDLEASGIWDVAFYEGQTITDVGTLIAPVDMDRESASSPDSLFYYTPTIAVDETLLADLAAGDIQRVQVASRGSGPFTLKAGESYVLYATNRSGAVMDMGVRISCTEVPQRT